ncbi:MAG: hypothetical protein Q7T41_00875 [Candidatus Saccharibacteria bacterium]|nr:hypothetical protein [Candidatus Saccharibacteria bacterium]
MALESYGFGGVLVERKRIVRTIAQAAFNELMSAQTLFPGTRNEIAGIEQYSAKARSIRMFPSVSTILDELRVTDSNVSINVNFQKPNAEQKFHLDNPAITMSAGMLAVVHLSDEGAFDFSMSAGSLAEAYADHERITPLGMGDVVYQLDKFVPHRGANLGNSTRLTLGIPLPYSF